MDDIVCSSEMHHVRGGMIECVVRNSDGMASSFCRETDCIVVWMCERGWCNALLAMHLIKVTRRRQNFRAHHFCTGGNE